MLALLVLPYHIHGPMSCIIVQAGLHDQRILLHEMLQNALRIAVHQPTRVDVVLARKVFLFFILRSFIRHAG